MTRLITPLHLSTLSLTTVRQVSLYRLPSDLYVQNVSPFLSPNRLFKVSRNILTVNLDILNYSCDPYVHSNLPLPSSFPSLSLNTPLGVYTPTFSFSSVVSCDFSQSFSTLFSHFLRYFPIGRRRIRCFK